MHLLFLKGKKLGGVEGGYFYKNISDGNKRIIPACCIANAYIFLHLSRYIERKEIIYSQEYIHIY